MLMIRKAEVEIDAPDIHRIIKGANLTVADDLNLTKENAPSSPAFIELDNVIKSFDSGIDYYMGSIENKAIGCVAIEEDQNEKDNYFIERLAVLPEYRHNQFGKQLLDHSISEIRKRRGKTAGIAIINENRILKEWYVRYGFVESGLKNFEHLPFTVCFLKKSI